MTRNLQIECSGRGSYRTSFKIGPLILGFATLILIGALSFFYLSQTNETVIRGYEIKDLEKRLEELKKEGHDLELKAAELESIERIREKTEKLNMIKIAGARYIKLTKEEVALIR